MIASDAYMLEHIYYQCILWTFCWKNSSVKTNLKQQLCTMAVCKLFRTEWATLNPLGFADLEKILPVANPSQNFLGFVDLVKILQTADQTSQNIAQLA